MKADAGEIFKFICVNLRNLRIRMKQHLWLMPGVLYQVKSQMKIRAYSIVSYLCFMFSISFNDIIRFPKMPTTEMLEQWKNNVIENAMLLIIRLTLWFRAQISKVRPGAAIVRTIAPARTNSEVWNCYDVAVQTGLQQSPVRCRNPNPDNWWNISPSTPPFVVLMNIRL